MRDHLNDPPGQVDLGSTEPWQERVIAERKELLIRYERLVAFLSSDGAKALDGEVRHLMNRQSVHMLEYLSILDQRIARF